MRPPLRVIRRCGVVEVFSSVDGEAGETIVGGKVEISQAHTKLAKRESFAMTDADLTSWTFLLLPLHPALRIHEDMLFHQET